MFENKKSIDELIHSIREFAFDVNQNEIADHIKFGNLTDWCNAWRDAFEREIDRLKESIK